MEKSKSTSTNFISVVKSYFKGVKSEWFKITWPEKKQVVVETIYVIVICFAFTIFILFFDMIFKGIFSLIK